MTFGKRSRVSLRAPVEKSLAFRSPPVLPTAAFDPTSVPGQVYALCDDETVILPPRGLTPLR